MIAEEVSIPSAFVLPFSAAMRTNEISWPLRSDQVTVSSGFLIDLIKSAATMISVDEKWYTARYPDISAALEEGKFRSARHHYVEYGFFEDRIPRPIAVDANFYLIQYPDVAIGVRTGAIESAQWHFERYGFREGRLPYAGWRLME